MARPRTDELTHERLTYWHKDARLGWHRVAREWRPTVPFDEQVHGQDDQTDILYGDDFLLVDALYAAIARLPLLYQQVMQLREFDGLSFYEISEQLNLKLDTVKCTAFRARMQLRELMRTYNPHIPLTND